MKSSRIKKVYNAKEDWIPAEEVFPELKNPVTRAATCLRGMRYRQDMTQKQLADRLGIHQHHLSEMENGKRPIGKHNRFLQELGLPVLPGINQD